MELSDLHPNQCRGLPGQPLPTAVWPRLGHQGGGWANMSPCPRGRAGGVTLRSAALPQSACWLPAKPKCQQLNLARSCPGDLDPSQQGSWKAEGSSARTGQPPAGGGVSYQNLQASWWQLLLPGLWPHQGCLPLQGGLHPGRMSPSTLTTWRGVWRPRLGSQAPLAGRAHGATPCEAATGCSCGGDRKCPVCEPSGTGCVWAGLTPSGHLGQEVDRGHLSLEPPVGTPVCWF